MAKSQNLDMNLSAEELDKILKKIAILEKMGVSIDWDGMPVARGYLQSSLLKELEKELEDLNRKIGGEQPIKTD